MGKLPECCATSIGWVGAGRSRRQHFSRFLARAVPQPFGQVRAMENRCLRRSPPC